MDISMWIVPEMHGLDLIKITGYTSKSSSNSDINLCQDLNTLYARFDNNDHLQSVQDMKEPLVFFNIG